jgi:hypothetical protein
LVILLDKIEESFYSRNICHLQRAINDRVDLKPSSIP